MSNRRCKCVVRGSINHDEYFFVDDIAKPGETKASKYHESRVGGKGANQAVAIARAGGAVQFYGTIGKDCLWIKEELQNQGIDVSGIIVSEPTGRAIIQVSDDGENSIILFHGANHSELHEERKFAQGEACFPDATHLLLQNEIHPRSTFYALQKARNMVTIYNPSPIPSADEIREFPWNMVDWLLVNEGEAQSLCRYLCPQRTRLNPMSTKEVIFCLAMQPMFVHTNIICTLGGDGVLAFMPRFHRPKSEHEGPSFLHLPAAKLVGDFRDTTGAGDCFTGYFVQGLMEFGPDARVGTEIREFDVAKILKVCVQAAGMSVEKPGTMDSIPTRAQVELRLHHSSPLIKSVVTVGI